MAKVKDGTMMVDGEPIDADAFVFAAGPWLPKLLGAVPGLEMSVPQQEIIYFATPPGDPRFDASHHPTWVEYDAAFYGLPSIEGRGFKVAPDWPGPMVDPDCQERRISDERVEASRTYLRRRFPALADQPVAEGRVCQYELTVDTHFIIDRHPAFAGGWSSAAARAMASSTRRSWASTSLPWCWGAMPASWLLRMTDLRYARALPASGCAPPGSRRTPPASSRPRAAHRRRGRRFPR
jgi:hypothetical protein